MGETRVCSLNETNGETPYYRKLGSKLLLSWDCPVGQREQEGDTAGGE